MKVVYFNQWFSSISNVIEDLKNKYSNTIKIIASSRTEEHSYRWSVDEFFVEDWEGDFDEDQSMKNYVDWVLNLCEEHKVDVFFVKKHAKYIMERAEEFEELGVKLISENYDTLCMMESKSKVYDKISSKIDMHRLIPEYHIFLDVERAISYIEKHRGQNDICFKFNNDEGGASFRHICDTKPSIEQLYHYEVNKITTDNAITLMKELGEDINMLMFMELLDEPEISVDCYNSVNGFVSLARVKVGGRKQKLYYNENIAQICKNLGDTLGLKYPYNVQFRVTKDGNVENIEDLRLLEINPRMSGGLYYEVLCGMNIAELVLTDVLNIESKTSVDNFKNFEDNYITFVEKAIRIN